MIKVMIEKGSGIKVMFASVYPIVFAFIFLYLPSCLFICVFVFKTISHCKQDCFAIKVVMEKRCDCDIM